jgi:hypothetical protein
MQRRVAAIYFVFFLVLGASAYSVIALAEEPAVDVSGDTYQANDVFTLNGQEYTVGALSSEEVEAGHGGGITTEYSGTITWTNESFHYSEVLANNSTVAYNDGTYRVLIPNESDPGQFTLHQEYNVSQVLAQDSAVENQTVTRADGQQYVVYNNGTTTPLSAYLPEPATETHREGDTVQYNGTATTVGNVSAAEVPLEWQGEKQQSVDLSQETNITLGQETYLVHFDEAANSVTLTQDFSGFHADIARQVYYKERIDGLWGVVILSGIAAVIIVMLAYLPVRG